MRSRPDRSLYLFDIAEAIDLKSAAERVAGSTLTVVIILLELVMLFAGIGGSG
jgi:hypothetical protein